MAVSAGHPYAVTVGADDVRLYKVALIALALVDLLYLAAFAAGIFDTVHWFEEDGPMENFQIVVLAIATLVSARAALRQQREGRIVCWFLFAMFLSSAWREMELRGSAAPEWLIWMFYGTGQSVFIVAIFVIFFVTQLRHWRELPRIALAVLQPRTLLYLAAGIVLLSSGIAEIAEHYGMAAEDFEELLELNGYLLFLFAVRVWPFRDLRPGEAAAWVGAD